MDIPTFLKPISEAELREVYRIVMGSVGPRINNIRNDSTRFRFELLEKTQDGNKLVYNVALFLDTTEPVLEQDLERWLCDNKLCLGQPKRRGKVAVRVRFYIRHRFQAAGLASYLLRREETVFRKWGAHQVQVWAYNMGRWVWTCPRFGYQLDEFEFGSLQEKYKQWQRARGATLIMQGAALSDFPRDFLLSEVSSLNLFKNL